MIIIALEKGFSNFKITFSYRSILKCSHQHFLWYSQKLIFQLRKGRSKWADISLFVPQLQIGLIESQKLCLNSCSRRWFKPSLNLVNNLTPSRLLQLKTLLSEGCMDFKRLFLKLFKLSKFWILMPCLFNSITTNGKKNFQRSCALLSIVEYH